MAKGIMGWMTESNRGKHFLYAIPVAFVFTLLAVLGCASGMEYKDKAYGNKWDWLDWAATMLGGLVGQALQLMLALVLVKAC